MTAVAFGPSEKLPARVRDHVDIAYRLRENEWQGTFALELRLVDVKA